MVLLAGLLLRGLVPQGFMPDWHAAARGVLTLTICSADGGDRVVTLDADGNLVPGENDAAGQGHGVCGFTPVSGMVPLLLAVALLLPIVWRRQGMPWPTASLPSRPRLSTAHGARAPPAFA